MVICVLGNFKVCFYLKMLLGYLFKGGIDLWMRCVSLYLVIVKSNECNELNDVCLFILNIFL